MADQIEGNESKRLDQGFFERAVEIVAPDLVGYQLFTTIDGQRVGGVIIETEAYDEDDVFSHCYNKNGIKPPKHAEPMFFDAGSIYLYYSGQMLCLNISCDKRKGFGSAVLIRALYPTDGIGVMWERRKKLSPAEYLRSEETYQRYLCNGPGNLCDSLGLGDEHYKRAEKPWSVLDPPFELWSPKSSSRWLNDKRYGLDKQLAKLAKADPPRAKLLETQSHLERKWRWRLAKDAAA